MDPTMVSALINQFGPTGVVAVLGIYALKALMPLAAAAVGHLGRMADAMQQLVLQITVIEKKLDQVQETASAVEVQVGAVSEDLAGLYGSLGKARPSRSSAGAALRGATGD